MDREYIGSGIWVAARNGCLVIEKGGNAVAIDAGQLGALKDFAIRAGLVAHAPGGAPTVRELCDAR
jgi:hypothetical protein